MSSKSPYLPHPIHIPFFCPSSSSTAAPTLAYCIPSALASSLCSPQAIVIRVIHATAWLLASHSRLCALHCSSKARPSAVHPTPSADEVILEQQAASNEPFGAPPPPSPTRCRATINPMDMRQEQIQMSAHLWWLTRADWATPRARRTTAKERRCLKTSGGM